MTEQEIFIEAMDRSDPADRQRYLDEACAGDAALRERVERLIGQSERLGSFLEHSPVEAAVAEPGSDSGTFAGQDQTLLQPDGATFDDREAADSERIMKVAEHDRDDEIPLGYLLPSSKPNSLGRLGHYEILEVVGRGAFGTVLRAFDEKLQRVVAIKVLAPEMAATSPARKRFLREARTSAAIRHENVVAIYAVEDEPIPYLVMEYIPGRTLQQRLDHQGPLGTLDVLKLGKQIADGLAAAHAQDLIHRDVKPGNILLEGGVTERVKITDFGLARTADDASMTQSGLIAGTPMYMAPEQAMGQKLDQRADLFSLGSVLYQMLSGRPPFRASNTVAVLKRVVDDTPRPIQEIIPEVPTWMCDVVSRLHAKNPDERFQTAREVSELLAKCMDDLKAGRTPKIASPPSDMTETTAITPVFDSQSEQPARRHARGHAPLATMTAFAIVLFAVLAITESTGVTRFNSTVFRKPDDTTAFGVQASSAEKTSTGNLASTVSNDWPADAPPPAIAPFDAAQAKAHQEAWAKYLGVPVEYTNSLGMKFRLIPPGEFFMGSTPEEVAAALKQTDPNHDHWQATINSEAPQHQVILTRPFYLGVNEVTQAEYEKVMGSNPSHFASQGQGHGAVAGLETGRHPVEMVSWNEAAEFCSKLSQLEKLKPFYSLAGETITSLHGTGYRLPSEAEWEFACRAGTVTKYWIGNTVNDLQQAGWFEGNSRGRTHAAGELKANPFGLHDVHGNVWEWVQDGWDATYYRQFQEKPAINPDGAVFADPQRVLRGGNWLGPAMHSRSSLREAFFPSSRAMYIGFRVSLSVDAVRVAPAARTPAVTNPEPAAPSPAIAPFDVAQARAHQEAWAKHLGVPVEYTNSIGMKLRLIPPGEFLMGSTPEEIEVALTLIPQDTPWWRDAIKSEAPQHKVVLTQPIYFGETEVTQAQYEQVMGTNPSQFASTGQKKDAVKDLRTGTLPVETVSWHDAAEFCAKLSQQNLLKPSSARVGETITPLKGTGYRLPSEAEWEFACRAGTTTRFWSGNDDGGRVTAGWCLDNSDGRTHAAGEWNANPFGLSDMHGNVWEWVQDGWDAAFYGQFARNAAVDPYCSLPASARRVMRGGALADKPFLCGSSGRNAHDASIRDCNIGFRVVLPVDAVKQTIRNQSEPSSKTGWHGWPADAPSPAIAPFDAAQAKAHQEAWAKYLGVPVEYTNSIGMKLRLIPSGEFLMGSTPEEIAADLNEAGDDQHWRACIQSETPRHNVSLTRPIYLGVNEVTQAEYEKVMGVNPSQFSPKGLSQGAVAGLDTGRHPVEMVSWNDAAEFCAKLSQREDLKPFYFRAGETVASRDGTGYRLPSEAEWEFACRAGTATKFWRGDKDEDLARAGWFSGNSGGRTHAVGELQANPFGLHDIHGNVWEWVQDGWNTTSYSQFSEKPAVDPSSPFFPGADARRVLRGGDWLLIGSFCRSAHRHAVGPSGRDQYIGFRVSLPVDAVKQLLAQ